MKITDLQLESYGIYRGASWQPSGQELMVIMGENESGKTTLLRFIRDMIFGYRRGEWHGREGNMAFLRDNGDAYRVFRHEKDSWFIDGKGETSREELGTLWWHGLNRQIYETIFAVGLEDLQGADFLSQGDVRSRFFMLQGGEKLEDAQNRIHERIEELFVSSVQGKRRINVLLSRKNAVEEKLQALSSQEEEFAGLQKKQKELTVQVADLQKKLKTAAECDKQLEKQLGAWEYYKRARDIRHRLDLSEQVKMFPANGKEQWNNLMSRMAVIRDQKEKLQGKLDEYAPLSIDKVIPWAGHEKELDHLYTNLGQWRQVNDEVVDLEEQMNQWREAHRKLGASLDLWNRDLQENECTAVGWDTGRKLAHEMTVRNNEIHFWEQSEPKVEELADSEDGHVVRIKKEEDWEAFETASSGMEALVRQKDALNRQVLELNQEEVREYTPWFWLGILLTFAAVGGAAAFYMSAFGDEALYGTVGSAVAALLAFYMNGRRGHSKEKKLSAFASALSDVNAEQEKLDETLQLGIPENESEISVFREKVSAIRNDFYQYQAREQAMSWHRETVTRQQDEHEEWKTRGSKLLTDKNETEKAWKKWLASNHLPDVSAENLSALQEQWQTIYSSQGQGQVLSVLLEKARKKQEEFQKEARIILSQIHTEMPAVPDSIAQIYEENRKRSLKWEAISERNRQHDANRKEMDKLEDQWMSCQKEMHMLLALVNAKNAGEFAERVNAHEQQDQLKKEWEAVRRELRMYAGSEKDFQELWKSLETGQYEEWIAAHHKYEKEIEEETALLGELQKQQGGAERDILRLAGDGSITAVLQEKQEIDAEMDTCLAQWLTYVYIQHFLAEAQKQYEVGRRPRIIEEASRFLQMMTQGRYRIEVSKEGKDLAILDQAHNSKEPKTWSSGTGDQVYLALRLAMALAFGRQIESMPIVLDDIFVRFDEKRQEETFRFLFDLGREQQIFLFTCHAQTMKIAEKVGREKKMGCFVRLKSGRIDSETKGKDIPDQETVQKGETHAGL